MVPFAANAPKRGLQNVLRELEVSKILFDFESKRNTNISYMARDCILGITLTRDN